MEPFHPGPEAAQDFRRALGRFATGVTVITCHSEIGPIGITANSFASLSLDPPLVLWSPAKSSRRFHAFTSVPHFSIHVMAADQAEMALAFVGDGQAWEGVDWHEAEEGTPLIRHCLARFDCARHAVHAGGDHAIVVGRVLTVQPGEGEPLLFADGRYGRFAASG